MKEFTMDQIQTEAQGTWKAAKAEYLRALWAKLRVESKIERLNGKIGEAEPKDRKPLVEEMKEAKSLLSEKISAEGRARKEYLSALEIWNAARKGEAPAPKIVQVEEVPVRDPKKSLSQRAREMVESNGGEVSLAQAKKILRAYDSAEAVQSPA